MMKSCIMHAGWKTQSLLCAANKRMGATLSSKHLFMSDCANLEISWVFFLFLLLLLLRTLLEKKMQVIKVRSTATSFLFCGWSECFGVQRESHCCRFTLKACVQALQPWIYYTTERKGKQKEGLWVSGNTYLDDFINQWAFSMHTPTHKHTLLLPGNQQTHTDL